MKKITFALGVVQLFIAALLALLSVAGACRNRLLSHQISFATIDSFICAASFSIDRVVGLWSCNYGCAMSEVLPEEESYSADLWYVPLATFGLELLVFVWFYMSVIKVSNSCADSVAFITSVE